MLCQRGETRSDSECRISVVYRIGCSIVGTFLHFCCFRPHWIFGTLRGTRCSCTVLNNNDSDYKCTKTHSTWSWLSWVTEATGVPQKIGRRTWCSDQNILPMIDVIIPRAAFLPNLGVWSRTALKFFLDLRFISCSNSDINSIPQRREYAAFCSIIDGNNGRKK